MLIRRVVKNSARWLKTGIPKRKYGFLFLPEG